MRQIHFGRVRGHVRLRSGAHRGGHTATDAAAAATTTDADASAAAATEADADGTAARRTDAVARRREEALLRDALAELLAGNAEFGADDICGRRRSGRISILFLSI